MATLYTYPISASFTSSGGKVHNAKLMREIQVSTGSQPRRVTTEGDVCTIEFPSDLPTNQEANLTGSVTAHNGVETAIKFHASSTLIGGSEGAVTGNPDWQVMGGVVTNTGFFTPNLANVLGRLTLQAKTTGGEVEIQIVENNGVSDVVANTAPFVIPDTGGAWQTFKFLTNVPPRAGDNVFRLEARLTTASAGALRFFTISMLEVVIV